MLTDLTQASYLKLGMKKRVKLFARSKAQKGKEEILGLSELQNALEGYGGNSVISIIQKDAVYSIEMDQEAALHAKEKLILTTRSGGMLQLKFHRGTGASLLPPPNQNTELSHTGLNKVEIVHGEHPKVSGLFIFNNFISESEESQLLQIISGTKVWNDINGGGGIQPVRRRVTHFGFEFDYAIRRCDPQKPVIPLPEWLKCSSDKRNIIELLNARVNSVLKTNTWGTDQLTINEYTPGQGIPPHVDTHSAFYDGIASISIGALSTMRFAPEGDKLKQQDVLLSRRSLAIFTGEARYRYTHGIPQRRSDFVAGLGVVARETRYSLTFRHIKRDEVLSCPDCPSSVMCDLSDNYTIYNGEARYQ